MSGHTPIGYCEDWQCPSGWSCAKFYGRSQEYAALDLPGSPLFRGPRGQTDFCDLYERDAPKPWLAPQYGGSQ